MTKIIDLRPDRKLINSKFEKYQFCTDSFEIKCEKKLQAEILPLELTSSQDSWLEARLFAFHNHLFKNPYDSTCWFIDKEGRIWEFKSSTDSLDLIHTSKILSSKSSNCIYNSSIAFGSKNIIVICNGAGSLEFLERSNGNVKTYLFEDIDPAVILDATFVAETSKIIVALYKIEEEKSKRYSRLIFLFFNFDNKIEDQSQILNLIKKQTIKVKGVIENVYIEKNGRFCHIISQDQIVFDFDSINPIEDIDSKNESKIPKYYWSQGEDDLTVHLKIPEIYASAVAKVEATATNLSVTIGDTVLLQGKTSKRLESELTTWKRKENTLEIELSKHESGLMWNELIEGDTKGEYLPNETLAAEVHERLSHLCSDQQESNTEGQPTVGFNSEQLEECDLSGAENILQRINFDSHKISHMAMLGCSNRVLFAGKQSSGQVICLRYDHDGCVWLLGDSNTEDWDLNHSFTFPGFGYVEASKTNKKFCVAPPNGSYVAIVEHIRHIFLYEKPEKDAKIGKQRIFDLGSEISPIVGAAALNKHLILLTKDMLYQLEIYS